MYNVTSVYILIMRGESALKPASLKMFTDVNVCAAWLLYKA